MLKPQSTVIDPIAKRAMFIFSEKDCRDACCDMIIGCTGDMGKSPHHDDREGLKGILSELQRVLTSPKLLLESFSDMFGILFYDHWEWLRAGTDGRGNVVCAPAVPDIESYEVLWYMMETDSKNLIKFDPSF